MFAGNFAPRGWAFCDGQLLPISQYSALFSILGTTYGGDGRTTFALPDFRSRTPIHEGTGPGLPTYRLGQKVGSYYNILTVAQLPSHTHVLIPGATGNNLQLSTDNGTREIPQAGDVPSVANFPGSLGAQRVKAYGPPVNTVNGQALGGSFTVGNTGGSQQVNNMQPSIAINYIICMQGLFPSRS
ncbi:phage tail protein [Tenacibaculum sp. MEBiC06402]|uniref:phage tail protein n=1 Tax=unclassified Tenacibaculum TaxID=2635139 RepID=UPI003B9D42D6